jgi:hypothetical protein
LFDLFAFRMTMAARQKRGAIAKKRRHPGRGAEIARPDFPISAVFVVVL